MYIPWSSFKGFAKCVRTPFDYLTLWVSIPLHTILWANAFQETSCQLKKIIWIKTKSTILNWKVNILFILNDAIYMFIQSTLVIRYILLFDKQTRNKFHFCRKNVFLFRKLQSLSSFIFKVLVKTTDIFRPKRVTPIS